jgi:glycosyltransferase involved in cell wall biosynthesis
MTEIKKPKLSIGMPIYNAEDMLKKRLDSLLAQQFSDFELIISDNASTDMTSEICNDYVNKDKRIRYIHQKENMGLSWNFNFVLKEAQGKYFVWAASDDMMLSGFIEKNIDALEKNENLVCSMSRVKFVGKIMDDLDISPNDSLLKKIEKKVKKHLSLSDVYSVSGKYEDKIRYYLKRRGFSLALYGIYRTIDLKKSIVERGFHGDEWAIIFNALRYGDFHIVDEVLMHKYVGGTVSSNGMIKLIMEFKPGLLGKIIPYYDITKWCAKNLGAKIFLKNLDCFIKLNCEGYVYLFYDIARRFHLIK